MAPLVSSDGKLTSVIHRGRLVNFFSDDPQDYIQGYHRLGKFYEPDELGIIEKYFTRGGVYVDIGANVGNHLLWVGLFLDPAKIIPVEANPGVLPTLISNININGLRPKTYLGALGLGLSDRRGSASRIVYEGNAGATQFYETDTPEASILMQRGDDILTCEHVDFIKMDVEGMEMKVLAGLEETIARCRPTMFVEVHDGNRQLFDEWIVKVGYRVETTFRRYETNENFLILPN